MNLTEIHWIWADASSSYKDVKDTAENNLQAAIAEAESRLGKLKEASKAPYDEIKKGR